ncbi:MAG: DUF374 domain-containing protein [Chlorobi bacterium]|nr:DUF374 domain-containing protein [Chlorobiota bacterium]
MKKGWKYYVSKTVLSVALKLLSTTWRFREGNADEVESVLAGREPAVIAFLHGKMVPVWYRFRGGAFAAIVSASHDGELLTHYLKRRLGYHMVVRGSSSEGGSKALFEIIRLLEYQSCLITPDGPRGPLGEPKAGAMIAAQRAGRRVIVINWKAKKTWDFDTWDHMSIPYPFSHINIRYCTLNSTTRTLQLFRELLNKAP